MKKIFTLTALATAGLLIACKSDAQVYVHARIGLPFRGPRVYMAPPPVYYQAPAPVYQAPYPSDQATYPADQSVYADPNGYAPGNGVVYEDEFPGYAYYDYPAWNGHYRDYYYYAHYRPFFERRYAGYFNGGRFDRGRFDRGRFQRENYSRGYAYGGYANRGYGAGRFVNRGTPSTHGYANRTGASNRSSFSSRSGFSNHGGGRYGHGRR